MQVTCKVEDTTDDDVTPDSPMSTTSTSSRWGQALRFCYRPKLRSTCMLHQLVPGRSSASWLQNGQQCSLYFTTVLAAHAQRLSAFLRRQTCPTSIRCRLLLTLLTCSSAAAKWAHTSSRRWAQQPRSALRRSDFQSAMCSFCKAAASACTWLYVIRAAASLSSHPKLLCLIICRRHRTLLVKACVS